MSNSGVSEHKSWEEGSRLWYLSMTKLRFISMQHDSSQDAAQLQAVSGINL